MVYKIKGVCSQLINVEVENNIVTSVEFVGGCNGNTQGVAALVEGMDVHEAIRRLEKLETLTGSYPGVEKAYAIQAGREVRIMVKPEEVSEDNMILLARDLAKKIESELEYPGQIKVNVIRETKAVEYAK